MAAFEYTAEQLTEAILAATKAGNLKAAEGLLTLLGIHYPKAYDDFRAKLALASLLKTAGLA